MENNLHKISYTENHFKNVPTSWFINRKNRTPLLYLGLKKKLLQRPHLREPDPIKTPTSLYVKDTQFKINCGQSPSLKTHFPNSWILKLELLCGIAGFKGGESHNKTISATPSAPPHFRFVSLCVFVLMRLTYTWDLNINCSVIRLV